jgi:hypothetical protein
MYNLVMVQARPISYVEVHWLFGGRFHADVLAFLLTGQERTGEQAAKFQCIEDVMAKKHEPKWNIEDLTDTEIYAAIHYLEAGQRPEEKQNADDQGKDYGVVICVCLYILLAGCLSFLWFYWR